MNNELNRDVIHFNHVYPDQFDAHWEYVPRRDRASALLSDTGGDTASLSSSSSSVPQLKTLGENSQESRVYPLIKQSRRQFTIPTCHLDDIQNDHVVERLSHSRAIHIAPVLARRVRRWRTMLGSKHNYAFNLGLLAPPMEHNIKKTNHVYWPDSSPSCTLLWPGTSGRSITSINDNLF